MYIYVVFRRESPDEAIESYFNPETAADAIVGNPDFYLVPLVIEDACEDCTCCRGETDGETEVVVEIPEAPDRCRFCGRVRCGAATR